MKRSNNKKSKTISVYKNYHKHIVMCYKVSKDKYFRKQIIRNWLTLYILPYSLISTILFFIYRSIVAYPPFLTYLKENYKNIDRIVSSLLNGELPILTTPNAKVESFMIFTGVILACLIMSYILYLYKRKSEVLFEIFEREHSKHSNSSVDEFFYYIKTPRGLLVSVKESTVSSIKGDKSFWEKAGMTPGEYIVSKDKTLVFFSRGFALPKSLFY
jgi:hypothetical protein